MRPLALHLLLMDFTILAALVHLDWILAPSPAACAHPSPASDFSTCSCYCATNSRSGLLDLFLPLLLSCSTKLCSRPPFSCSGSWTCSFFRQDLLLGIHATGFSRSLLVFVPHLLLLWTFVHIPAAAFAPYQLPLWNFEPVPAAVLVPYQFLLRNFEPAPAAALVPYQLLLRIFGPVPACCYFLTQLKTVATFVCSTSATWFFLPVRRLILGICSPFFILWSSQLALVLPCLY